MGCDIHLYVERKNNNKWEAVVQPEGWEYGEEYENWLWNGRNYRLFAILADVRNSDGLEPLDYPRGLPDDVSDFVRQAAPGYGDEYHSHSWFGLQELLDWDWDKPAGQLSRYVSPEDAEAYQKFGKKPAGSAMYTSNESWTSLTWDVTYRDCALDFLDALERLRDLANPEDLRIVFWFDN